MLEKFKLVACIAMVFLLIGISINKVQIHVEAQVKTLEKQLKEVKAELAKTNEDNKKLHTYLTELEASDDIDKQEIILMWHSIGTMRGNFIALGLGFHLEEEDICPEEETDCYNNGWEDNYEG